MGYLQSARRFLVRTGIIVAALFVASLSPAFGDSTYTVPEVWMLAATLPGGILTPETHLLCLVRAEEDSSEVEARAVCYASYKPGPPPELPPSVLLPAYHQLLPGDVNQQTLTLHVFPCIEVTSGTAVGLDLVIPLDKGGGAVAGDYTVWTTDTNPPLNCADGTETSGALTLTPLDQSHDEDGDGCSDWEELGTDETYGGLRDPFNPWDFYDTNGDGVIDLFNDIVGVISRFGLAVGDPGYDPAYDRGEQIGPYEWNIPGPDGVIDLFNDVAGVIQQSGHDCRS